jgi:hypothetical protein
MLMSLWSADASLRAGSGRRPGSIVLDEHLLINPQRDHDYSGGGEITFSGDEALKYGNWLDQFLQYVDDPIAIDQPGSKWQAAHAFAAELLVFTPSDLGARQVVAGDRPYASLFFVSSGRRYTNPEFNVAYDSSLTVGVLGLAAAESVQHALHSITGSTQPEGWSHQISDGGEPTARYSLARQALLTAYQQPGWSLDSKWTAAAVLEQSLRAASRSTCAGAAFSLPGGLLPRSKTRTFRRRSQDRHRWMLTLARNFSCS